MDIDIRQRNKESAKFLKKYQNSNATLRDVYLFITDNSTDVLIQGIAKGLASVDIPDRLIGILSRYLSDGVKHNFVRFKDYMLNHGRLHLQRTEFVSLVQQGMLEAFKWMKIIDDDRDDNVIYVDFAY